MTRTAESSFAKLAYWLSISGSISFKDKDNREAHSTNSFSGFRCMPATSLKTGITAVSEPSFASVRTV